MAWNTAEKSRREAERHLRIARVVLWKLRHAGVTSVRLYDIRTDSGVRLHPANLACGARLILCRPVGWIALPGSEAWALVADGAYLQTGSADITGLLAWLSTAL